MFRFAFEAEEGGGGSAVLSAPTEVAEPTAKRSHTRPQPQAWALPPLCRPSDDEPGPTDEPADASLLRWLFGNVALQLRHGVHAEYAVAAVRALPSALLLRLP
jgi:hypothetical protein